MPLLFDAEAQQFCRSDTSQRNSNRVHDSSSAVPWEQPVRTALLLIQIRSWAVLPLPRREWIVTSPPPGLVGSAVARGAGGPRKPGGPVAVKG